MQIFKVFLRLQSSTAPQFSEQRISKWIVEQNVGIPGGGLRGLRPAQVSTASSSSAVSRAPTDWLHSEDKAFRGFFHTFFLSNKSAKVTRHSRARVPRSALTTSPMTATSFAKMRRRSG